MTDAAWPRTIEEAVAVQKQLRHQVRIENSFDKIELIAGVDVSYDIQSNLTQAFVVLMTIRDLKPVSHVVARVPTTFPYVPGFLSFRETPAVLQALAQLPDKPDLLMVDGQGIAHPRRFGIACHLGVLTDIPAIGVAKSRLTGNYTAPEMQKGSTSPLTDKGEIIGAVLRSRDNTNPLFVSPGHRIDLNTTLDLVKRCIVKHRLPEPTRIADKLSKEKDKTVRLI